MDKQNLNTQSQLKQFQLKEGFKVEQLQFQIFILNQFVATLHNYNKNADQHLQKINQYKRIIKLRDRSIAIEDAKIRNLQKTLQIGLMKQKIKYHSQLIHELQEKRIQISQIKKTGIKKVIDKSQKQYNQLRKLSQLSQEIHQLKIKKLSEQRDKKMTELQFSSYQELEKALQQLNNQILRLNESNKVKKKQKKQTQKQNLLEIQTLNNEINKLRLNLLPKNDQQIKFLKRRMQMHHITNQTYLPYLIKIHQNYIKELENANLKQKSQHETILNEQFQQLQKLSKSIKSGSQIEFIFQQNIEKFPQSAEKVLLKLMQLLKKSILGDNNDNEIIKLIDILKQKLKNQQLLSNINLLMQQLLVDIKIKNYLNALSRSQKLLKFIRPLDLHYLKFLVQKTYSAAQSVQQKQILLLFGGTGCGKSTLTHFFCGSKLEAIQQKIQAVQVKNPQLKNVNISSKAVSQTRYITPIKIEYQYDKQIFICDSPGYEDTNGVEVDVANSIGILKAIKSCKNLRLIILLSRQNIGNRGEGIKRLVNILCKMISKAELANLLNSVTYVYTKFLPNQNIKSFLQLVKGTFQQQFNQQELLIINHMINKTNLKSARMNPLIDNPNEILGQILQKTVPYYEPYKTIQVNYTKSSRDQIIEQAKFLETQIEPLIKNFDVDLLNWKLQRLENLLKITQNLDQVKSSFQKAKNSLKNYIKSRFDSIIKEFKAIINQRKIQAGVEVIEKFKNYEKQFLAIKNINLKFFNNELVKSEDLLQQMRKHIKEILSVIFTEAQTYSIKQESIIWFKNVQIFRYHFGIQNILIDMEKNISQVYAQMYDIAKFSIQNQKINEFLVNMKKLQNLSFIYNAKELAIQNLILYFDDQINRIIHNLQDYLNLDKIQNDELSIRISKVNNILVVLAQVNKVRQEYSSKIPNKDEILKKIFNSHFEKIKARIQSMLKNQRQDCFGKVCTLINQIQKMRQNTLVEKWTQQTYYLLYQLILRSLSQYRRKLEQFDIPIVKLHKLYSKMQSFKSINMVGNEFLQLQSAFKNYLEYECKNIKQKISDIEISFEHYDKLDVVQATVKSYQNLSEFLNQFPDLKQKYKNIVLDTINKLDLIISYLRELFDLQQFQMIDKIKEKENLINLKNKQLSKQMYKILEQRKFKYVIDLQNAKSLLQNKIKKSNQSEKLLISLMQIKNKYNQILQKKIKKKGQVAQYLQKQGYRRIEELEQKIKQTLEFSDKISLNKNQNQLKLLNQLKKKYDQLATIDGIQRKKSNTLSLQQIQQKINNIDISIEKYTKQMSNFGIKISAKTAQISLLFTEKISKLKIEITKDQNFKKQAKNLNNKIKNFIKVYSQYIKSDLRSCYKTILKIDNIQQFKLSCETIQNKKDLIKSISKQSQIIYNMMQGKSILDQIDKNLTNLYILFDDKIKQTICFTSFRFLIEIAKSIKIYIQKEEFLKQINEKIAKESELIQIKIQQHLQNYQFNKIDCELRQVDEIEFQKNNIFLRIKRKIYDHIHILIQKSQTITKRFDIKNINSYEQISQILRKLSETENLLLQINKNNIIQKIITKQIKQNLKNENSKIKNILQTKIKNFIEMNNNSLITQDFVEFQKGIEILNNFSNYFCFYISSIDQFIQNSIQNRTIKLTMYEQKYSHLSFQIFTKSPPNKLIEKLYKPKLPVYTQTIQKISQKLTNLIQEQLNSPLEIHQGNKKTLKQLETFMQFFPQDIKIYFQSTLKNRRIDI